MEWVKYNRIDGFYINEAGFIQCENQHRRRIIPARRDSDKYGFYRVIDFKHPQTNKWTSMFEHQIVCHAFNPIEDVKGMEVNHIDSDKMNNHPKNLEWSTKSENRKHAYRVGANPINSKLGSNNGRAKLDWVSVGIIREAIQKGYSTVQLGRYFNVSQTMISCISLNKNWVI